MPSRREEIATTYESDLVILENRIRSLEAAFSDLPKLQTLTNALGRMSYEVSEIQRLARETRQLVGPVGIPLPDGKMLVQTLHNNILVVDPLDELITPQLIFYRQWEPDVTTLLCNSVNSDTVFVDVGANVGYFTCLVGSIIRSGSRGKIFSVEPNPECAALLRRNVYINWSMCEIEVHEKALSNFHGMAQLAVPTNRAGNASLSSDGTADAASTFQVSVSTLDSLVPEEMKIDIIKIDVEGHELSVLDGAHEVISRSPDIKIIMEWSPSQMESARASPQTMFDMFEGLNLLPRKLPASLSLKSLSLEDAPIYARKELCVLPYQNILLTRR
jgi:FkbM family methyltransferase